MGTYRQDVYDQLRANLYLDDAVAGEAAGIAMGMVMLGSKEAQAIQDMVAVSTPGLLPITTPVRPPSPNLSHSIYGSVA